MVWERLPTAEEISRHIPRRPIPAPEGAATLDCRVTSSGELEDCQIVKEEPGEWGYGDVALKASRYFRAGAITKSGKPTADLRVRIPMVFRLPVAESSEP